MTLQENDMAKLAIIDLDGVVANNDERFALARDNSDGRKGAPGPINWRIAFDPALVPLDVLMKGADKAIKNLEKRGYSIVFLTSRPETMRQATAEWLRQRDLDGYELICKPMDKQFTKTVTWKADEVARMARIPIVESVLFIDDEANNLAAVEALGLNVVCKASLDDYIPQDEPIIL